MITCLLRMFRKSRRLSYEQRWRPTITSRAQPGNL